MIRCWLVFQSIYVTYDCSLKMLSISLSGESYGDYPPQSSGPPLFAEPGGYTGYNAPPGSSQGRGRIPPPTRGDSYPPGSAPYSSAPPEFRHPDNAGPDYAAHPSSEYTTTQYGSLPGAQPNSGYRKPAEHSRSARGPNPSYPYGAAPRTHGEERGDLRYRPY